MDDADRAQRTNDRAMRRFLDSRQEAQSTTWRSGVCGSCGDMIEIARLQAYPAALYCIDCQIDYERKSRHG